MAIYLADCAGRGNAASTIEAEKLKLEHVVAVELVAESGEAEASRVCAVIKPLVDGRGKGAPLFERRDGARISRSTFRRWLKHAQGAVGLETKGAHVLRHSAAPSALPGGAGLVSVQKLLGHQHLVTTVAAYLHDTGDAQGLYHELALFPREALSDAESAEILCDEARESETGVMPIDVVPCRPARVRLCAPATLSARVRATSPRERGGVLVSPAERPWRPVLVMMSARL